MSSFAPRTVVALVVFGALAFVALLWFIGQGDTGPGPDNGGAHAQGRGLAGYAGLADMLRRQGYEVSLSRSAGHYDDESLLVLTPDLWIDAEKVADIIEQRRYIGSTLLILPKWYATRLPASLTGARKGWVQLIGSARPEWTGDLEDDAEMSVQLAQLDGRGADWHGLGLSGNLPARGRVLGLDDGPWMRLAEDSRGRDLVAYADDGGCYPVLDAASKLPTPTECNGDKWALVVAFEPDLFNNYGMADRTRALFAAKVIELAREGQDIPVVFDLTLNGYGATRNLLTLAFQPPFLAATLCLLLALAVAGWRAFARFGPPFAEARTIAFGKARLAANAAGVIRRSGRLHLLGPPFVELTARRIAAALGLRRADPAAIDAALAARAIDGPPFTHLAARMTGARGPSPTLRAAHALRSLEKSLERTAPR